MTWHLNNRVTQRNGTQYCYAERHLAVCRYAECRCTDLTPIGQAVDEVASRQNDMFSKWLHLECHTNDATSMGQKTQNSKKIRTYKKILFCKWPDIDKTPQRSKLTFSKTFQSTIASAKNTSWREGSVRVTSTLRGLFKKVNNVCVIKSNWSKLGSTMGSIVLRLPLQWGFPGFSHIYIGQVLLQKHQL